MRHNETDANRKLSETKKANQRRTETFGPFGYKPKKNHVRLYTVLKFMLAPVLASVAYYLYRRYL